MAAATYPVDIVDRYHPVSLHGVTWHRHVDAMLDELSRLYTERDTALHHLLEFLEAHPDMAEDQHLLYACDGLL